jgi:DNA-binding beta-propeller fold protein YncE
MRLGLLGALASTAVALIFALALAAPASAATEFHRFSSSFGESGEGDGQLALTASTETGDHRTGGGSEIAINQETGNVYVPDTGNGRVDEFSSSGSFIRSFGVFNRPTFIAIDNSTGGNGSVYVADSEAKSISKFEADGTPVLSWATEGRIPELSFLHGIAVGPDGDLFILFEEARQVQRYTPEGVLIGSFQSPEFSFAGGLAVDSEGHLYQVNGDEEVEKFTDTGEDLGRIDGEHTAIGLALDPATDDLYVLHSAEGGFVSHFAHGCGSINETCQPLDAFERNRFAAAQGIAISAHRVYVGDAAVQNISIFPPAPGVSLTVTHIGAGVGEVTSIPLIQCGSHCAAEYAELSSVTLTAIPNERSTFTAFGAGDCDSEPAANKCTVDMTAAKSVSAEFTAIPQEKLTITRPGSGSGTVTGTSPGQEFEALNCGSSCEAEYNQGSTITLTANPAIGSRLAGWTGCNAQPASNVCKVTLSSAVTVEARFVEAAGHLFSLNIEGSGPTELSGPTEVAVDQASHAIYVNDPGHYRVEKFSPTGAFLFMLGREVNQSTGGDLCPVSPGDTCQFGASGTEPGQFQNPSVLAIDGSGGSSDGDLYVADSEDSVVQKFDPSGHLVTSWRVSGQNDGSGAVDEVPFHFRDIIGMDVNETGELFVDSNSHYVWVYAANGNFLRKSRSQFSGAGKEFHGFKVDPAGHFYEPSQVKATRGGGFTTYPAVVENSDSHSEDSFPIGQVTSVLGTTGFEFDPVEHTLYQDVEAFEEDFGMPELLPHGAGIERYDPTCDASKAPCDPVESFGTGHLFGAQGISVDGSDSTVYVANSETSSIAVFLDNRPSVTTGEVSATTETGATVNGEVDPASHGKEHGAVTECVVEYGLTTAYGHSSPCQPDPAGDPPSSFITSPTHVEATISQLLPLNELPNGSEYHYRFVAVNGSGSVGRGVDRVFRTTAPPRIEGVSSAHLTATSVDLQASVDPHGLATSYVFEYGATPSYGQSVSGEIAGDLQKLSEVQDISAHVEGLQAGVTYHFRLVTHNSASQTDVVSDDQTFSFFPSACPNSAVRQQTGAAYLPDCRGYELVSPGSANATLYSPGGPNTGLATNPSRLSYTGGFSATPGVDPINTAGDLYVATRTGAGWKSHYIGLNGNEAGCMGGPPTDPRTNTSGDQRRIPNTVLTDPSMSHFLDFIDGTATACTNASAATFEDQDASVAVPSNAPYLWSFDGTLERRLPSEAANQPGGLSAFDCPYLHSTASGSCAGETAASGDLSKLFFSSTAASYSGTGETPGVTTAPGSAYEDDLATGKISLISTLPASLGGGPIRQDPAFATTPPTADRRVATRASEEFIRFPAVSTDGSHVLMSTSTVEPPLSCRLTYTAPCGRYVQDPLHLYMRMNDETYEIAENASSQEPRPVTFVGMTPDGTKVFFTSAQNLTEEDPEHVGSSLFMWDAVEAEQGVDPITLISKGPNEAVGSPGNVGSCEAAQAPIRGNVASERLGQIVEPHGPSETRREESPWTTACGVVPYSGYGYSYLVGGRGGSGFEGTSGGSGFTPAGISANGDIYFYSAERLDGVHGADGQQNLFLYRNGHLQYVTTLDPERRCGPSFFFDQNYCSDGPIVRLQTTPDDSRMAFITATQVTPYNNAGHLEMYIFTPASGDILCVSCRPDGKAPLSDVYGSQDGLFITNDGRSFFSTTDPLVPRDTNEAVDVYEYAEGRPQLITPGTGTAASGEKSPPGLVGVSADGTDVYFSTQDVLIPEDHNGNFLKFYDARSGGGFPQQAPAQPCAAAEECHGASSAAPGLPTQATSARLDGGNARSRPSKHRKHRRHRGKKHRHHKHQSQGERR